MSLFPRRCSDLQAAAWVTQKWQHRAATASYPELERIDAAIRGDVANLIAAGCDVAHTTYASVMRMVGRGRGGSDRCAWWYDTLRDRGVRPGESVHKALLKAQQAHAGNLRRTWELLSAAGPPSVPLQHIYLRGLIVCDDLPAAKAFYAAMPARSMVTHSTLLAALPPLEARECFDRIAREGETPDYLAHKALMFSLCRAREVGAAEALLVDMRHLGVRYDVQVFHLLMRVAPVARVVALWDECVRDGIRHNTESYNILIERLGEAARTKDDSHARAARRAFFTHMDEHGVAHAYKTCEHMLQLCAKVGDPESAERVRDMDVARTAPRTIPLVLDAYTRAAACEEDPGGAPIFTARDSAVDALMAG